MKTTHAVSTRRNGLGRQITSVLLTLSLSVGMIAATATPAHAASYVRGCFSFPGGGYNSPLWDMPVELWAFSQNTWYVIGRDKLGPNGCQDWNVPADLSGYFLLMVVNTRFPATGAYYSGNTPDFAWPGNGLYDLGTGVVTCTGCW